MARVYERQGRWYYEFRFQGKHARRSAGAGATKKDAQALLGDALRAAKDGAIYGAKPEATSFEAFARKWLDTDSPQKKSKGRDREIVAMLTVEWKGRALAEITPQMIDAYKARRCATRAPATVNKELQVIKRLFKIAHRWGTIAANPATHVEKLRVSNTRVRFLEPDEMERLEAKIPEWLQPIVAFARFTGARRGEILSLTWNDVDMKRETITFRETKNGHDGTIEMNARARQVLESLPAPLSRSQRVFPPVKIEKLRKAWLTACRKARIGQECGCSKSTTDGKPAKACLVCGGSGIDVDFRFHDLRHQAATDLLTEGAELNDVRAYLRHGSMAMTLRYGHLVKARRTQTARLLDNLPAPAWLRAKRDTPAAPRDLAGVPGSAPVPASSPGLAQA
jgi:integrase